MSKPRIAVLALGGTISMVKPEAGESGVKPGLGAEELIAAVPGIEQVAELSARTISKIGSSDLTVDAVLTVAEAIEELVDANAVDGVVVTQGTDTMEESSFLLDLALNVDIPVAVTGAMRNPLAISHDGPGNVLAAVQVVADASVRARAKELGVMVVMLDQIHAAVDVAKANSHRIDAFASPEAGPLGILIEDRVRLTGTPVRTHKHALDKALSGRRVTGLPDRRVSVALQTMSMGERGAWLKALADDPESFGYCGLIIGATGGGHTPEWTVDTLSSLVAKMPVVMAGRMQSGYLLAKTYGRPGSEIDLLGRGVVSAGRLPPLKARLLLTVMLMAELQKSEMDEVWACLN